MQKQKWLWGFLLRHKNYAYIELAIIAIIPMDLFMACAVFADRS